MSFVTALRKRAKQRRTNVTATATTRIAAPTPLDASALLMSPEERRQQKIQSSEKKKGKRNTFSRKDPHKDLPTCRLEPGPHTRTWMENKRDRASCEWCKLEIAVAKRDKQPLTKKRPVKTHKYCSVCGPKYRLCEQHFDIWHEQS